MAKAIVWSTDQKKPMCAISSRTPGCRRAISANSGGLLSRSLAPCAITGTPSDAASSNSGSTRTGSDKRKPLMVGYSLRPRKSHCVTQRRNTDAVSGCQAFTA